MLIQYNFTAYFQVAKNNRQHTRKGLLCARSHPDFITVQHMHDSPPYPSIQAKVRLASAGFGLNIASQFLFISMPCLWFYVREQILDSSYCDQRLISCLCPRRNRKSNIL